MTSGYDMTEDTMVSVERLQIELAAAHAALRSLLGAIPECKCESDKYNYQYDCMHCALEYEIGIAQNLLGEE